MPTREDKQQEQQQAGKASRVDRRKIKRDRRQSRALRRRDWMRYVTDDPEDWDNVDYDVEEALPGSGERVVTDTTDALDEEEQAKTVARRDDHLQEGIVVELGAQIVRVDVEGKELLCYLRGWLSAEKSVYTNVVAVGDRVLVKEEGEEGQGVVEEILPRSSVLARPDVHRSHLNQIIVANADQILIVASWDEPPIWLELIDRYLVSAQIHKLEPIICLNKIDLAGDDIDYSEEVEPYISLGYQVIFASAMTGEGVDQVADVLRDKITVLAGLSGVGKSSLLTAIQPELDIKVAEVSDWWHQGRHTTTQVTMHRLDMGGYVVDTPGIREFGLSGLFRDDLAAFYPEFLEVGRCQYPDCVHLEEPGCAVKQAVEDGEIPFFRYENYVKIYESLPAFTP